MKPTALKLIRWAGLSAMVGGIFYVVVGMFHQPNILSSVTTTQWAIVHALATAMCFFFLLGITGLYARQVEEAGWLGLAGFLLFSLNWMLTAPFTFAETFILPLLATEAPKLAEGFLGIFTAGETNFGVLANLWTLTAALYILGSRSACRLGRVGPLGCAASARAPTESCGAGGVSSGLAGLCALV
jgi:hypothetical protein